MTEPDAAFLPCKRTLEACAAVTGDSASRYKLLGMALKKRLSFSDISTQPEPGEAERESRGAASFPRARDQHLPSLGLLTRDPARRQRVGIDQSWVLPAFYKGFHG